MLLSCSLNEWIQNNIVFNLENSTEEIFIYILSLKGWKSRQEFCLLPFFFSFLFFWGWGGVVWIALTSFYTCRCFNGFIGQIISDIRSRFSIYSSHHLPCQSEDLSPWKTGAQPWNPHGRPVHYLSFLFHLIT